MVFLLINNAVPRINHRFFQTPLNWEVKQGEVWTILGNNGSGKSLFSEIICKKYNLTQGEIIYPFFEKIKKRSKPDEFPLLNDYVKTVSFNSIYSFSDFRNAYYQQRFNSTENDSGQLVEDFFTSRETKNIERFHQLFDYEKLKSRQLIMLSSGELRKVLILKVLTENPKMIIFDNPFIGLDEVSRKQLDDFFHLLHQENIQLLFLVPSIDDLPSSTTHILEMENGKLIGEKPINLFFTKYRKEDINNNQVNIDWGQLPNNLNPNFGCAVKMIDVNIAYGKQIIAKNINWEIKKGEKWALLGANGSGKSTLLSYIFADNPQAYSKNLVLFDRKRGTGESIWDIKKRIGFTSSEMHLYYRENVSCLKVVESGFFDSIGLYRKCSKEQTNVAEYIMKVLKIEHLSERSFLKISSGEQRLVLFARSLVKNPDLLILDEPFHGLDDGNKKRCLQITEEYGKQPDKSIIFVTHRQDEIPQCINHFIGL